MVLAESFTPAVDHRAAATTAASIHLHYEGSVIEQPLARYTGIEGLDGIAVLAPTQGLVEWFPHDDQPLADLAPMAREVDGSGVALCVVVPASRMGEAHRALRGEPLTLQPWWRDGETVRFGGPEVP
ncbi:MAG: hypothetical protein WEA29_04705 [Acidimicrobiia bacterium]